MKNINYIILCGFFGVLLFASPTAYAGNPDRQGEAGAYELLLNPWARSSGMHGLVTASVRGVEAMNFNAAGLGGIKGTEILLSRTNYFTGSGMGINALGFGQKVGTNGVIGLSLTALEFGDIDITTTGQPEGIGSTFSPQFFNIALGYAHNFSERISCGLALRLVSETISNASASGIAFDAGVQYTTGPKRNVKFGIALRNIGGKMRFKGDGFSFATLAPSENYNLTVDIRSNSFEMPSLLNIGLAYDLHMDNDRQRLTFNGNFTANSFSTDQLGVAVEYAFKEQFMVRGGYRYESNNFEDARPRNNVATGLSAGASLALPLKKGTNRALGLDYSYQTTNPYSGNHTIGLRLTL